MATSDQEQKSVNVPYHKRIAQGANLDGTSLQEKGQKSEQPKQGGLAQTKKK